MTVNRTDTRRQTVWIYPCEIDPLTLQEKEDLKLRISADIDRYKE